MQLMAETAPKFKGHRRTRIDIAAALTCHFLQHLRIRGRKLRFDENVHWALLTPYVISFAIEEFTGKENRLDSFCLEQ